MHLHVPNCWSYRFFPIIGDVLQFSFDTIADEDNRLPLMNTYFVLKMHTDSPGRRLIARPKS